MTQAGGSYTFMWEMTDIGIQVILGVVIVLLIGAGLRFLRRRLRRRQRHRHRRHRTPIMVSAIIPGPTQLVRASPARPREYNLAFESDDLTVQVRVIASPRFNGREAMKEALRFFADAMARDPAPTGEPIPIASAFVGGDAKLLDQ